MCQWSAVLPENSMDGRTSSCLNKLLRERYRLRVKFWIDLVSAKYKKR